MRKIFPLLVSLFGVTCFAQEALEIQPVASRSAKPAMARYSVDLARPGAMGRLEETNPEHYAKVLEVIRVYMTYAAIGFPPAKPMRLR